MGEFIKHDALENHMTEGDDKEVFLSLEDEPEAPSPPVAEPVPEPEEAPAVLDAEVVDTTVLEDASGSYSVSWPLMGMDCPDCAAKAMGALGHMKQVN